MSEDEVRFRKAFIASLADIKASLDENTEAVREHTQAAQSQQSPPILPVVKSRIRLPPTIKRYINAQAEDEPGTTKRDKTRLMVESAVLLISAVLAWLTLSTLRQIKKQTDAAQKQVAVMREQFALQQRPWLRVDHALISPLSFNVGGRVGSPLAIVGIKSTIENVGPSLAVNIGEWMELFPLPLENGIPSAKVAEARQAEYCDANRHPKGISGFLIYPKEKPFVSTHEASSPMERILNAAVSPTSKSRISGKVGFLVVGCIWYKGTLDSAETPTRQIRFSYNLGVLENGGFFGFVAPEGSAPQLIIIRRSDSIHAD